MDCRVSHGPDSVGQDFPGHAVDRRFTCRINRHHVQDVGLLKGFRKFIQQIVSPACTDEVERSPPTAPDHTALAASRVTRISVG